MKLNDIELSKEDADKIIKEMQENKNIYETDREDQEFIRECLIVSKKFL